MRVSISKLKQLQHLQWCSVCNKVNEAAIAKPSALLIGRFKQHFHSHWDSPGIKSKEAKRLRDSLDTLTPHLWFRIQSWHMPGRPCPAWLLPSNRSSEGGGYPFFCIGQIHNRDRKPGKAQAWLELCRPANTSESEKGGPGQQQHSFEFLLITFSHNFILEISSTPPSYLLSFLSWSLGLPSSFTSLLMTKQNMKISCPSRVTLIVTCPLSGPQKQPPGTPRTPRSQQKSKAPLPHTQLSLLALFLPS